MSNGIADFFSYQKDPNQFNFRDVADFFVDPDDPLSMALAPLYFAGPLGGAANRAIMAGRGGYKVGKNILNKAIPSNMAPGYVQSLPESFIQNKIIENAGKSLAIATGVDLTDLFLFDPEMQEILNDAEPEEQQQLLSLAQNIAGQKLSEEMKPKMADGGIVDNLPKNKKEIIAGVVKGTVKSIKDIYKKHFGKKSKPKEDKPKTSTDKSKESLEQSSKAKKERGPDTRTVDPNKPRVKDKDLEQSRVGPQQPGSSVPQGSANVKPGSGQTVETGNLVTRAGQFFKNRPITSGLGAAFVGSQLIPFFAGDSTDNQQKEGVVYSSADISNLGGNTDDLKIKAGISGNIYDKDYDPTLDRNLGDYINQNLASKGVTDPSFFDYIKALPSAYMKKVGDDPSFAKKMMAGFLNMMKPQEGIVPISAPVAFGEGYLGEETRQADMLPADVRTLKFLQQNPDLKKYYTEMSAARSGLQLSDVDPENLEKIYNFVVTSKAREQGITSDDIANYQLVYNGLPVSDTFFSQLLQQNPAILADPNFALQLKSSGG
jgi:hypothetical protein